ncbi:acyl-CoA thioesterase [Alphaproteobacteria bacterium KMM 3653]|uniref:Acyl-CoA thioesterase n=1 Tax=Harenicola maris TaxID=2841044 RepID=A0AAP2G836_9RHOB|nr:acyl-CoA thioesterase [Harenicola maris]
MYPTLRLFWQYFKTRNLPELPFDGTHVSTHICMPWDLDMWKELNNGRTLTLFDLGRIPLARRMGLLTVLKEKKWGLTMAGASVRYRRRVRRWDKIEMHSRITGFDDKFVYIVQSMWVRGECCNQALYRSAVTGKSGIIPPVQIVEALGRDMPEMTMPDWVQNWITADATRPWPPEV